MSSLFSVSLEWVNQKFKRSCLKDRNIDLAFFLIGHESCLVIPHLKLTTLLFHSSTWLGNPLFLGNEYLNLFCESFERMMPVLVSCSFLSSFHFVLNRLLHLFFIWEAFEKVFIEGDSCERRRGMKIEESLWHLFFKTFFDSSLSYAVSLFTWLLSLFSRNLSLSHQTQGLI